MRPSTANKVKGNSPNSKLTQENDIYTYTNLKKILFRPKRPQSSKKLNKTHYGKSRIRKLNNFSHQAFKSINILFFLLFSSSEAVNKNTELVTIFSF